MRICEICGRPRPPGVTRGRFCRSCYEKQRAELKHPYWSGKHRLVRCRLCNKNLMHKDSYCCLECRKTLSRLRSRCRFCQKLVLPGRKFCDLCLERFSMIIVTCSNCGGEFETKKDWHDYYLPCWERRKPETFLCTSCGKQRFPELVLK